MPMLRLSTGSVHYTEQGQGAPLVLLHANPGDSRDFAAVIPALAENYRVIALDWLGYGQSDLPAGYANINVLHLYNALREFIDALGLPPAFFIGNSVGGNAAARLAAEHPEQVRGLVLVAPGGFTPHNFITRFFCRMQGSRFALSPQRFASMYLKVRTPTAKAMLERARNEQATPERVALSRALWRSFGQAENDLRQIASSIKAPTLLLFGEKDIAIPANKDGKVAARSIPHAAFSTLPCGHASFAEVPEQFLSQAQPFLALCSESQARSSSVVG